MSNLQLLVRSLLIILILTGIPHAFAYWNKQNKITTMPSSSPYVKHDHKNEPPLVSTSHTGYWTGHYFEGNQEFSQQYWVEASSAGLQAYAIDNLESKDLDYMVLSVWPNGNELTGTYHFDTDGRPYSVDCQARFLDANRLQIEYQYDGYPGHELWTRTKK